MSSIYDQISEMQSQIQELQKNIQALRKSIQAEPIQDYELTDKEGKKVMLSSLFQEKDELLLIHNMGKECRYCTMWADGLRGFSEVISDRMPWVLASPNEPSVLKEFSESRNWNFNVVSFAGTSLGKDMGYETEKEGKTMYHPGVSALIRKDGQIYRTGKDSFGPGDPYNSVWHFFDLFPKGADGWQPKYVYGDRNTAIDLLA